MAVGKNKRLTRGGKKGAKKKTGDPFLKKEWYDLQAPSMFPSQKRTCGKTLVSKTQGTKIASDGLKGRIVEINRADLYNVPNEDEAFKKIRMCIEDVQGKNCLMTFHGLDFTRDRLCFLVRKWQTLIEANVDVKTVDGYTIRLFCIAFTTRQSNQVKSNCYAQSAQIRRMRHKMKAIIAEEISKNTLQINVKNLIAASIETEIKKKCLRVFPLTNVFIRKVKVLKKPKFDITKLMELHQGDDGAGVDNSALEHDESKNLLTAELAGKRDSE